MSVMAGAHSCLLCYRSVYTYYLYHFYFYFFSLTTPLLPQSTYCPYPLFSVSSPTESCIFPPGSRI